MNNTVYNELVDDAYINSIRSAIMIDDEFPTYQSLLEKGNQESSQNNLEYLNKLCDLCHDNQWTYHVEQTIPDKFQESAPLLSKADVIFLDYCFKGEIVNGDQAVKTIYNIATSDRFNTVIIYTENDIYQTLGEISVAFGYIDSLDFDEEDCYNLEIDYSGITECVKNVVKDYSTEYFNHSLETESNIIERIRLNRSEWKDIEENRLRNSIHKVLFSSWKKDFDLTGIKVRKFINDTVNYMQINNVFLTVIRKKSEGDILEYIRNAFHAWKPSIGQLILKNAVNQLDQKSLCDCFCPSDYEAAWFYFTYIDKQLSDNEILINLLDEVKLKLNNVYSEKIHQLVAADNNLRSYYENYDMGEDQLYLYHDINVSKSMLSLDKMEADNYLHTGTLLKLLTKDDNNSENSMENKNNLEKKYVYWLCMTQSCDLMPDQHTLKWGLPRGKNPDFKPITLVALEDVIDETDINMSEKTKSKHLKQALKQACRGNYIFFRDEEVDPIAHKICYLYTRSDKHDESENPYYEVFIAPERGKYVENKITLKRLEYDQQTENPKIENVSFSVIGQMRYEYACQFLSKLCSHRSRIGVDYISKR